MMTYKIFYHWITIKQLNHLLFYFFLCWYQLCFSTQWIIYLWTGIMALFSYWILFFIWETLRSNMFKKFLLISEMNFVKKKRLRYFMNVNNIVRTYSFRNIVSFSFSEEKKNGTITITPTILWNESFVVLQREGH